MVPDAFLPPPLAFSLSIGFFQVSHSPPPCTRTSPVDPDSILVLPYIKSFLSHFFYIPWYAHPPFKRMSCNPPASRFPPAVFARQEPRMVLKMFRRPSWYAPPPYPRNYSTQAPHFISLFERHRVATRLPTRHRFAVDVNNLLHAHFPLRHGSVYFAGGFGRWAAKFSKYTRHNCKCPTLPTVFTPSLYPSVLGLSGAGLSGCFI